MGEVDSVKFCTILEYTMIGGGKFSRWRAISLGESRTRGDKESESVGLVNFPY